MLRVIKNLMRFLKPTITGPDGEASHRRITVFHFIFLLTWMIFKTATGSVFPEIAWVVVSGGAGLFSSLSIWKESLNNNTKEVSSNSPTTTNYPEESIIKPKSRFSKKTKETI